MSMINEEIPFKVEGMTVKMAAFLTAETLIATFDPSMHFTDEQSKTISTLAAKRFVAFAEGNIEEAQRIHEEGIELLGSWVEKDRARVAAEIAAKGN